jgi:Zn-dependent peptidase ImmA (M78 family)
MGIACITEHLDSEIDGLLIVKDGRSTICVNSSKNAKRQRFTTAHELGHHILGHYSRSGEHVHVDKGVMILKRSAISAQGVDPVEVEANQFAATLLMPSNLVRAELEKLEVETYGEEVIEKLATKFDVSVQAMTIRLTTMQLIYR